MKLYMPSRIAQFTMTLSDLSPTASLC